jgi:hypothetical protein
MVLPMSDPTFPPPHASEPEAGSPSAASQKKPWWRRWWAIAAAAVIVVVVIGAVFGADDEEGEPEAAAPTTVLAETLVPDETTSATAEIEEPVEPSATAPAATTAETTVPPAPSRDAIEGAPVGLKGDRASPVPAGQIADIGSGWRLQVLEVIDDATPLVLAENQFNDPPPDGARFTIVKVALGYFGFDDPQSPFLTSISAVASANRQLDSDCGVIPSSLPFFEDYFSGGVVVGNVCFVTAPEDAGTVQLYASTGFGGGDVFLDASASPESVELMMALRGIHQGTAAADARLAPVPLGTSADLGDGWTLTVISPAQDITDAVLAENRFNSPPPDGYRFVAFGVNLVFNGEGSENAFAVTVNAVGDSNLQFDSSCGVVPGELDQFIDMFAGGSTDGLLCFVTPVEDFGTMVAYSTVGFDNDAVFFATQ